MVCMSLGFAHILLLQILSYFVNTAQSFAQSQSYFVHTRVCVSAAFGNSALHMIAIFYVLLKYLYFKDMYLY